MKTIIFYTKGLLAWFWFLFCFFIGNLLLPFFWKKPKLTDYIGIILYGGLRRILNFKSQIEHPENLYKYSPCIYLANHQSNIDILTMSHLYPDNTLLIGKKELKWFPIFGTFFYGSGHILLDRKNKKQSIDTLNEVVNQIKRRGVSIWVFPEGTRNRGASTLLPFKKGAFHMAIAAQVPIVPIVHQHISSYFDSKQKKFLGNGFVLTSKVLEPILTTGLKAEDADKLLLIVREKMEAAMVELNKKTGVKKD